MTQHIADHIKVVLFDYDDTLVATHKAKWAAHQHIAKTYYNKDLTDEEILKHWGKPFHELIQLLYGTDDVDQAIMYNKKHDPEFPKILFVETIPLLQHLKQQGKKLGTVTANSRYGFEYDLRTGNVPKELFDYTQTADDSDYYKPDPRVFDPVLEWLKSLKVKPDEVLYVGDGLHDMEAAIGTGFNFLGVETGLVTADEFKKAGVKSIAHIKHLMG